MSNHVEDLNGLLIKPFQRICRYVLLLQELEKHIPEDWISKKSLKEAISRIQVIVQSANEAKRIMDNEIALQNIRNNLDIVCNLSTF